VGSTIDTANFIQLIASHAFQVAISLSVVVIYLVINRIAAPRFAQGAEDGNFKAGAETKAIRIVRMLTGLVALTILTLVWGIDVQSILIFASTTLTLLAVALVASWSLLSNVTAHFVLLLDSQFKRGTFVRILDADNYVEGYISELAVFNTKIVTECGELIAYPNNLFLTRPVIINPRVKLDGVGKIRAQVGSEPEQEASP
jgi:small-conductance mechanosensitive channel